MPASELAAIKPKRSRRADWIAVVIGLLLIGAAVYRCGAYLGPNQVIDDGSEVEAAE